MGDANAVNDVRVTDVLRIPGIPITFAIFLFISRVIPTYCGARLRPIGPLFLHVFFFRF